MYGISYGKSKIDVSVPGDNLIGYFEPNKIEAAGDAEVIIKNALKNPIGLPTIAELAKPGQKVAIVVDDNTRPTPTHIMLPYILEELHGAGIMAEDISIVFANGSHRLNTKEEQIRLLGGEHILEKYFVWDHDPNDMENIRYLGRTSRNTPVHVNRYVADADLRILLGLIKPHSVAGYTGGGKSILPGVSSIETIISDHNYEATGHPRSILGVIDGNPIRSDLEEAASLVYPAFILNVVFFSIHKINL
jgi:nickel-dependent lactate racemase